MNQMAETYAFSDLKLPPHSIEAEQSVLGGLMLDNAAWDRVTNLVGEQSFYRQDHRLIFNAISHHIEANRPADALTVAERLKAMGKLVDAGGFDYLQSLMEGTPSAANIRQYAEIINERAILRGLAELSNTIADNCYATQGRTASQILSDAESQVLAIAQTTVRGKSDFVSLDKSLSDVMQDLDERSKAGGKLLGVSTGFEKLDALTNGMRRGDLIILAGRPSMGKTALAINIAEHVSLEQDLPALVFSMEMSGTQLAERLLSSVARIDSQKMRTGQLDGRDWDKLSPALAKLNCASIDIDETPALTVSEIRSRARRMFRKYGKLGVIIIDYIQLMACPKVENRATEIGDITSGLKAMAKEFKVPVIALSQLNREVEKRVDKRPTMSDLRESGAIEQDADVIAFIYRDEVYNKNSPDAGSAEIIIAKQRNGPVDTVRLTFINNLTRFENYAGSNWAPVRPTKSTFRDGE